MIEMHKLLKRQLKKHMGVADTPLGLEAFISSINEAYIQNDMDKMMIDRSLEISSKELFDTIDQLKTAQMEILHSKEKIKEIAFHDALTSLPNRYMLSNEMKNILFKVEQDQLNCAVMFIDLDNFKKVNDVFGHNIGDEILSLAARRFVYCIRDCDKVFRYGGDEFLVILLDITKEKVINMINKMIKKFESPFVIKNHEVYTTPSVGVSFYPEDGASMEELIRNADAAMYMAKDFGKNKFEFFTKEIADINSRKLILENDLRNAVKNHEFILYYQPQIDMNTGNLCGLEALIRWQHPRFGLLFPEEFITIAEETGYIIEIGEWVLKTVCKKNKHWIDNNIFNIPVAVNVSAVQLNHSNFVRAVENNLHTSGLNPKNLVVEFTESIMQDTSKSFQIVNHLNKLGVMVAIDDFGTGYSSLSLIKDLNIDILKIDSYFIADIIENSNTLDIIQLIINMGNKLNFDIIIEGIENELQAVTVIKSGCKYGQGNLYGKPMPENELLRAFY